MQVLTSIAVNPEDAGRLTGHSRGAIYLAIKNKELVSFKSGKRRLIRISDLQEWIDKKVEADKL